MLESVHCSLSSSLGLWFGSGGKGPARTGNRHGGLADAPHNVYPTADGRLALICVTDVHWASLTEAMGRPGLRDDARFATLKDRVANMDAVDHLVSAWTRGFDKESLFQTLMRHRVPCAPVRELAEVVNDRHLHARGGFRRVSHPALGKIVLPTGAMRFGEEPPAPVAQQGARCRQRGRPSRLARPLG